MHLNNTVNKSNKFSPFQAAYGLTANLPIENRLGCHVEDGMLDPSLTRLNVTANKEEAMQNYQKQANKVIRVNEYKVGDDVLLKKDSWVKS